MRTSYCTVHTGSQSTAWSPRFQTVWGWKQQMVSSKPSNKRSINKWALKLSRIHSLFHRFDRKAAEVGDIVIQQIWVIFILILCKRRARRSGARSCKHLVEMGTFTAHLDGQRQDTLTVLIATRTAEIRLDTQTHQQPTSEQPLVVQL